MLLMTRVRPSTYHDSVTLMLVAQSLLAADGVLDAAVVMGTPANREILAGAGLLSPEAAASRSDDLVLVVKAVDAAAAELALAGAEQRLAQPAARDSGTAARPKTLAAAIAAAPDANLVSISVAGRHAGREARTALERGLHVFLFSDNVCLEDEIALKRLALSRGLLCMGPDAGTAIINGVALGFANAVPRGPVGVIAAAGTGLQAVTSGLARRGVGISQAIGVGGRDVSAEVGGMMLLHALRMLQDDPDTQVLVLVAKPPDATVMARVLEQVRCSAKPAVICFLGAAPATIQAAGAHPATTLTQAAELAAVLARGEDPAAATAESEAGGRELIALAAAERARLAPGQSALRGLFAGGTFCYEAQLILAGLPEPIYSNAPLRHERILAAAGAGGAAAHHCIDLGADEFTQGRLHPMLDPTLRNQQIIQAAHDPATAVILFDVVLGYGAHPDPAGATAGAVDAAQQVAAEADRHISFVASVCGTAGDPQRLDRQEAALAAAGVLVQPDNARAARLAGMISQGLP